MLLSYFPPMHILGYTLRPAEELADFAIVAGGLGVISGLGGRWFFAAPVVSGTFTDTTWGMSAWSYPAFETAGYGDGGDWANFVLTLWAMSGLPATHFPAPDGSGSAQTWFDTNMPGWGVTAGQNYVDGLKRAGQDASWGPLGQHAGIILLSVFAGGILARAGLLGARLAAARMPHPPALSL